MHLLPRAAHGDCKLGRFRQQGCVLTQRLCPGNASVSISLGWHRLGLSLHSAALPLGHASFSARTAHVCRQWSPSAHVLPVELQSPAAIFAFTSPLSSVRARPVSAAVTVSETWSVSHVGHREPPVDESVLHRPFLDKPQSVLGFS